MSLNVIWMRRCNWQLGRKKLVVLSKATFLRIDNNHCRFTRIENTSALVIKVTLRDFGMKLHSTFSKWGSASTLSISHFKNVFTHFSDTWKCLLGSLSLNIRKNAIYCVNKFQARLVFLTETSFLFWLVKPKDWFLYEMEH